MNIGIDLDNVALDYNGSRLLIVPPVLKKLGIKCLTIKPEAYHLAEAFNLNEDETKHVRKIIGNETLKQEEPCTQAYAVMKRLKERGVNFIVVTRRHADREYRFMDGSTAVGKDFAKEQVDTFFPDIFSEILFAEDKATVCKENGIDVLFDDELLNLLPCLEEPCVTPVAMDKPYNQYGKSLLRVNDWLEFEELVLDLLGKSTPMNAFD